jgi:hypothetical protein
MYYWWAQDESNLAITDTRLCDFAKHFEYMDWYYKRERDGHDLIRDEHWRVIRSASIASEGADGWVDIHTTLKPDGMSGEHLYNLDLFVFLFFN